MKFLTVESFLLCVISRAANGLFVFVGERLMSGVNVGSDFIVLGLLDGQVYLEFNNNGGFHFQSITARSQLLYNDAQLHSVNFTFSNGEFQLMLDNVDIPIESKFT